MSYVYISDLGQAPRVPTVAEKVALTNLVKRIETASSVKAAWEGYQDFLANTKPFQGWTDSCSSGFFSSCSGGDYDSMANLVSRVGQVVGGFTQVMTFASLSELLTEVRREIAAVKPGSKWDPTDSEVARELVSIMAPGAGVVMYFAKPKTASESVGQAQNAYLMWLQLAVIARDSGRITAAQYETLRGQAEPTFKQLGNTVVAANAAGSSVNTAITNVPTIPDALGLLGCVSKASGPVEAWKCLPTWGKVVVGVAGVGLVAAPVLYVTTVFAPAISAAGNVAERLTRKNSGKKSRRQRA